MREGNLRFKIDWASLIVGSKFTVFTLFYFVFEGNFPSKSPPGGLYLEGRFNGGCFALRAWGAYTWRGLISEFYGNMVKFENVDPLLASLPKQSTVISILTRPLIHWISIVTT